MNCLKKNQSLDKKTIYNVILVTFIKNYFFLICVRNTFTS